VPGNGMDDIRLCSGEGDKKHEQCQYRRPFVHTMMQTILVILSKEEILMGSQTTDVIWLQRPATGKAAI